VAETLIHQPERRYYRRARVHLDWVVHRRFRSTGNSGWPRGEEDSTFVAPAESMGDYSRAHQLSN